MKEFFVLYIVIPFTVLGMIIVLVVVIGGLIAMLKFPRR